MRRITLLIALTSLLIVLLSGCSFITAITEGVNTSTYEGDIADARFEQIVEAIETKDSELIKSLFSEKALSEAEDIDTSVDQLFTLIDGEVISWERDGWSSRESRERGRRSSSIESWYYLRTNTDTYIVFIWDYDKDSIDPSNEGLHTLRVAKAVDEEAYFSSWQDLEIPGIWIPEEYFSEEAVSEDLTSGAVQAE